MLSSFTHEINMVCQNHHSREECENWLVISKGANNEKELLL